MIEVVAEILRGPVFLAGETLHCRITLTNQSTNENSSINNNQYKINEKVFEYFKNHLFAFFL